MKVKRKNQEIDDGEKRASRDISDISLQGSNKVRKEIILFSYA